MIACGLILAAVPHRLERDRQDHDGRDRVTEHVSDGTTTWSPTYSGVFLAGPVIPDAFPGVNLLDPSWLVHYEWGTPQGDIHNGGDVFAPPGPPE